MLLDHSVQSVGWNSIGGPDWSSIWTPHPRHVLLGSLLKAWNPWAWNSNRSLTEMIGEKSTLQRDKEENCQLLQCLHTRQSDLNWVDDKVFPTCSRIRVLKDSIKLVITTLDLLRCPLLEFNRCMTFRTDCVSMAVSKRYDIWYDMKWNGIS